jgi:hypothetical protein
LKRKSNSSNSSNNAGKELEDLILEIVMINGHAHAAAGQGQNM